MRKPSKNDRAIDFFSRKTRKLISVSTEQQRAYTKYLEEDGNVHTYEVSVPLNLQRLQQIQSVAIRKDYFSQPWQTDFLITMVDGNRKVREIVRRKELNALPMVEKLELSRRYWQGFGVKDWKIVVVEG